MNATKLFFAAALVTACTGQRAPSSVHAPRPRTTPLFRTASAIEAPASPLVDGQDRPAPGNIGQRGAIQPAKATVPVRPLLNQRGRPACANAVSKSSNCW